MRLRRAVRPLMSLKPVSLATNRTRMMSQHLSPTSESPVTFESNGSIRRYILNRPKKLNALDLPMIEMLKPQLKVCYSLEKCDYLAQQSHLLCPGMEASSLCKAIIASGEGKAFCAGGDVRDVIQKVSNPATRQQGSAYFKAEFELDYYLASLRKPYVAICDGITMGGGVGLIAHAPFRIATERTKMAMPETKIGYAPDVGASYFLSRLDGEVGTYLALTGDTLEGRAVFDHGLATHYIPSSRISTLISHLAALDVVTLDNINSTIEELSDINQDESGSQLRGPIRAALDVAFRHNTVENILAALTETAQTSGLVGHWARSTVSALNTRSPLSLKIALELVRRGKGMSLAEVLQMEYRMASAFCNGASTDFQTGVTAVLINRSKENPKWESQSVNAVSYDDLISKFFDQQSPYVKEAGTLDLPDKTGQAAVGQATYGLPSENEIQQVVKGTHATSGRKAVNTQQVLATFEELYRAKSGVRDKVNEVLQRKCKLISDDYLQWTN